MTSISDTTAAQRAAAQPVAALLANWPWVALAASTMLLAAAHAFERFGGLAPCALCLRQREAHWIVAGIAALALVARAWRPDARAIRAFDTLLAAAFLASAAIAGFHAGVELKFWPGLPECAGGGAAASEVPRDLLGALSQPMDVPGCDTVPWAFAGISMAGWNMIMSVALAVGSLMAAHRKGRAQ